MNFIYKEEFRIIITLDTRQNNQPLNFTTMAKSQDAKKSTKKEPLKTAKEKKAAKKEKKAKR